MTKALKENYHVLNRATPLTDDELNSFQKALERRKEEIESNIERAKREMSRQRDSDLKDEGDYASIEISSAINATLLEEQSRTLNQIKRSLNKIAIGTYGICSLCEESINIERLKIKNFTEYCIGCQEIIEERR